jgi:hypothetical protein
MHRNKTFSIAVEGSGPFVGPLVTDGMRAFRNATWYDRTTATQQAIAGEVKLGRAGVLEPGSQASAHRAGQNLQQPSPVDVVVGLGTESGVARAHVCGQRKTRTVRAAGGQDDAKQVQRFIDDVLNAIGQVA